MSNLHLRSTISSYHKGSTQQTQQLPLRNRGFSQFDNIPHHSSQHQAYNPPAIQDKISGIKKKYEKILNNPKIKSNEQNFKPTYDFAKSVNTYDLKDDNSNNGPYRKPCITPTAQYERNFDHFQAENIRNTPTKSYIQKQSANTGKQEIKSQLQSNRQALHAMKSQLQSKLNDLNSKTKASTNIGFKSQHQAYGASSVNGSSQNDPYEAILQKYSKNNVQNGYKAEKNTGKSLKANNYDQANPKGKPDSEQIGNKGRYLHINKPHLSQKQKQDLSIISEISNSNHSDHKQGQLDDKGFKNFKRDFPRQNQQNTTKSYLKGTNYDNKFTTKSTHHFDHKGANRLRQQGNKNLQFTLQRDNTSNKVQKKQNESFFQRSLSKKYDGKELTSSYINNNPKYSQYDHDMFAKEISNNVKNDINFANTYQKSADLDKNQLQNLKDKYKVGTRPSEYINNPKIDKNLKSTKVQGRSNQTISKEIEKIDQKIKQIQQNKKDLNINFKPYDPSKSVNKNIPQEHQRSINNYDKQTIIPISNNPASLTNQNFNFQSRYQHLKYPHEISDKSRLNRPSFHQATVAANTRDFSKTEATLGIKYASSSKDEEQQSQRSFADSNFRLRANNLLNKFTDEKKQKESSQKKSNSYENKSQNQIKKLVKAFGEQASLDEILRNNKIWFVSQNKDKKWGDLKKQLENMKIYLNQAKLKQIFTLDQSQNNPFFSVSQHQCSCKSLAESYSKAQKNWQQTISHKFNRNSLENEGLNNKMDRDQKTSIQIEDLVRFLNLQSASFLRIRDVSIIFKRITRGKSFQFNEFLNIISQ